MPTVDATALTAMGQTVVEPVYFGFLDFLGDPLRATTFGSNVTFSGTGDAELNGTFVAFDPRFVNVSDVTNQQTGSDTLVVSLSGILSIDTALLNIIGDRSKWYKRTIRLWMRVHDEAGAQQGAIIPYYTGQMLDVRVIPTAETQVIEVEAENYLAVLKRASGRTYLNQADYDSGDLSAQATIGAANGAKTGPAAGVGSGGGGRFNPGTVPAFRDFVDRL